MRGSILPLLRGALRVLKRWAGLAVTLFLIMWFGLTMVVYVYVPLLSCAPTFIDVLLTIVAASAFFATMWSLAFLAATHPGVPPSWFAEERVGALMRGVLADVVLHGGAGGAGGQKASLEGGQSANRALAAVQELQLRTTNAHHNPSDIAVNFMPITEGPQMPQPPPPQQQATDASDDRRRRRLSCDGDGNDVGGPSSQLWMPHRNIVLVASDALAALDRSPESCEQEMSFLLGGARRCRFCRIYKLADTHHCSRCRMCVYEMDHHCPWIGQCIGRDNHKHFLLFMGYLIVLLGTSLLHILLFAHTRHTSFFLEEAPSMLLLAITFSGSFLVVLLGFCAQDLFLLGRGDSTLRLLRREERRETESRRSGAYAFLADDNSDGGDEVAAQGFSFQKMRRVFGTGSVCPWWFLPLRPQRPSPLQQETELWAAHRAMALQQLRAIADAADDSGGSSEEGTREQGEEEGAVGGYQRL